jgi:threonine aldolase
MSPLADLRSDTVTRPTPSMRRAIANAEVGDDVLGDDPTVRRLEASAAERLGKEAALFVPSGTMANQLAVGSSCRPGESAILEAGAHIINYEAGAAALIWGVSLRPLYGSRGMLDAAAVQAALPSDDDHLAPAALVCAEDTANRGGGTVWPLEQLDAVGAVAHGAGLNTHLDGARLFNAAVASGVPVARRAQAYDTVSICLSKGLGAPIGSLLCGPRDQLKHARRLRKALGGGMRQVGVLAAAGAHALTHHVDRLADDHARAATLAAGLHAAGYKVRTPDTNMVFVTIESPGPVVSALHEAGVWCLAAGPHVIRLVTHLDIDDDAVAATISAFDALPQSAREA